MKTLFYLFLIFLFIKLIQYFIKRGNEQNQNQGRNYDIPKQVFTQQQDNPSSYSSGYSGDEVFESSLGFYSFEVDDDKEEFYFMAEGKRYAFTFRNLLGYEIKTRNDAVITIELRTNHPSHAFLEVECFSKLKAVSLLPEDERRPLPLHRLYEEELKTVEEIGEILQDVLDDNKDYEEVQIEETPPPIPVILPEEKIEEKKDEVVVDNTPGLLDLMETIKDDDEKTELVSEFIEEYPLVEEYKTEPETVVNKPVEEQPVIEEQADDDLVRISLSDVEYYSYGKFLDSDIQSAVGDAKMRGKKEIFITKEQLEKLK